MLFYSSLLKPLIANTKQSPNKTLFFCDNKKFTCNDIFSKSCDLAVNLLKKGIKENDFIVIAIQPGIDFVCIIYAMILLRCRVAIIDPEMGPQLYESKLKQLNPSWAFVDSRLLLLREHPVIRYLYLKFATKPVNFPKVKGMKIIACGPALPLLGSYISFRQLIKKKDSIVEDILKDKGDHEFLVTFTSGTLQEPKGVLHSFESLNNSIQQLCSIANSNEDDIMATYLPHFALIGIAAQLPIILYDYKWSVERKFRFFETNHVTIIFGPPSDFLPLIKYCELRNLKMTYFRHIMLGSAPVHKSFLLRLSKVISEGCRITGIYGMTENLVISTIDGEEKMSYDGSGDLVGKPVAGIELKIASDSELSIRSQQLYSRYYHMNSRSNYHDTGDLAEIDNTGRIILKGRKKEMIIRRNTNIYPALYEDVVKQITGVDEAAFVGIYNNEKEDEDVILVLETSIQMSKELIIKKLTTGPFAIDPDAMPDKIFFMDIPRKGRQNKIDRNKLRKLITNIKA